MFTLRIIEEKRENENVPFEQVIENFEIGSSYSVVRKGFSREFDELMKKWSDMKNENVIAILSAENGMEFHIIKNDKLSNYQYFIMTENGKTFERL